MVGDINLFFNDMDNRHSAEVEIMIAEADCRRKGYAKEALQLMMQYAIDFLAVKHFSAKVSHEEQSVIF
jgi:RimJ/RimL family protein N-acetyltransferase